jgi:hypothetical protein
VPQNVADKVLSRRTVDCTFQAKHVITITFRAKNPRHMDSDMSGQTCYESKRRRVPILRVAGEPPALMVWLFAQMTYALRNSVICRLP